MKKISVITINFNNAAGLEKTIASVTGQQNCNLEFIVIDGGSTDGSVNVIKELETKITYWVSEKDKGIYDAQNKGIARATGDYLLFLNSGDSLYSAKLLSEIAPLLDTGKSFYYGNLILKKNNVPEKHVAPETIDVDFMLNSTFWHPCVFISADLFRQFGDYNDAFKIAGDYEFFIRCLLKPVVSWQYLNRFICIFDGTGISNDPAMNSLMNEEREKAWTLNISAPVLDSLKKHNAFTRSRYSKLINLIQNLRGK